MARTEAPSVAANGGVRDISTLNDASAEFRTNLDQSILPFWILNGIDREHGGMHGSLDRQGKTIPPGRKSLVQQFRIVWTFSAAYQFDSQPIYGEIAGATLAFVLKHAWDQRHGGFHWLMERNGSVRATKKHLYGQAFAIYGLSAYSRAFRDREKLHRAFDLFELIDTRARDPRNRGYHEAFKEDWTAASDDHSVGPPGCKSMNTHVHLLECFTELYRAIGDALVRDRIQELLNLVKEKIVDRKSGSARLYFTDKWKPRGPKISSYGHDIELSWLMTDAAQLLGLSQDKGIRSTAMGLVEHTLRDGFDHDAGGSHNEGPLAGPASDKKKIWWVQAETLVGLLNALELTGNSVYQKWFLRQANFVLGSMFDHEFGEWFHTIGEDGTISSEKGGEWRDPYHQSRACLEIVRRIERMNAKDSIAKGKSAVCGSKAG